MNKKIFLASLFFSTLLLIAFTGIKANDAEYAIAALQNLNDETELIPLDYTKEPLLNIIYFFGAQKNINIVVPQGSATIKEVITFKDPRPVSIDQFEQWIMTLLDMIGYIVTQKPNSLFITPRSAEALREPVELFIDVPLDQIPDSDQMIRYIYYLENTKATTQGDAEFNVVIKELLSPTGTFRIDVNANAYVIADKALNIKSVVEFFNKLDEPVQQETVDFIQLHHAEPTMVAGLLNELLAKQGAQDGQLPKGGMDTRKQSDLLYFAKGTKIFPIEHNNTVMVVGRPQAIERIKEFVKSSIDTEIGAGNSIFHIYQLQYLDANSLAPTLQRVVESSRAGGTGQSEAETGPKTLVKGNERIFDETIIRSDKPSDASDRQYYGGNNLIFGCRNDDYQQYVHLIQELDTPPSIVLLEVAVVDLTIEDDRVLGAITRNPEKLALLSSMQFQAANLSPGIILDNFTNPTTVAADLLQNTITPPPAGGVQVANASATASIAKLATGGSTVISLNDSNGKTWSMLQILKLFSNSEIISHPHVIAVDNKPSMVRIGTTLLLNDETSDSLGGAAVRKNKQVTAQLKVDITPRISANNTVSMQIAVTINDFITNGSNAQITREASTTVNVKSGSIFAMAGLSSISNQDSANKTPGLSEIPVIGWLFKQRLASTTENNLTLFISPTIIEPRLRQGVNDYTKEYIKMAKSFNKEGQLGLFDGVKDPISRWFFSSGTTIDAANSLDSFVSKDTRTINKLANPAQQMKIETVEMPSQSSEEKKEVATNDLEKPVAHLKDQLADIDNPFKKAETLS